MHDESFALLLDVRACADRLGVNPRWIYSAVENGVLPVRRIGSSIRFDPAITEAWLASCRRGYPTSAGPDAVLVTVEELAARISFSTSWIYEARRSKYLPHYKVGGHLRFSESEVAEWLQLLAN